MRKIKCIIVDDELIHVEGIRYKCERFDFLEIVKEYTDSEKFLFELPSLDFDMCFLDYDMPNINGIELAQEIKNKYIIFVTGNTTLTAAELSDIDMVSYITKPISIPKFKNAVEKLKENFFNNSYKEFYENNKILEDGYTFFKTQDAKAERIKIDQIRFIGKVKGGDSRDKLLILEDNSEHILKDYTLPNLLETLPISRFLQVNKSEIINTNAVLKILSIDEIEINVKGNMKNNICCTIGKDKFREQFEKRILKK